MTRPGTAYNPYRETDTGHEEPASVDYHTKLDVRFTVVDPAPGVEHRYATPESLCPGCGRAVEEEARRVVTGGSKTGVATSRWHMPCFVAAAGDPARIWILFAQQIARAPSRHTTAEIRVAFAQLVKLAAGQAPDPGRIEITSGVPYAVLQHGAYAEPEINDDGSVTFRKADPNVGPF